jgi:hypothetical protein
VQPSPVARSRLLDARRAGAPRQGASERCDWLSTLKITGDIFGRIEMVIYESAADEKGLRLDLMNEKLRTKVAIVTTREQLKQLFRDLI